MTSTLNPHFLSQMEATPTLNLQDGTDYPHSGLFDMLHKGLKGSFAYKASVTDFDITQSGGGSFTSLAIKGGAVIRNGVSATVGSGSGTTTTILLDTSVAEGGFTVNGTSVTANQDVTPVSGGDVYLMIVADANDAIKIRGRNADINKAPMLLTTDIPIAMVKMTANSDDDASDRPIQYFTTDKTENGLTLMYDNGGVAAAVGQISTSAAETLWMTTNDITFANPGSQTDLIIQDAIPTDAATGPSLSLKNNRPSAANNDIAGTINFVAADNAGSSADAPTTSIISKILNVAAGGEYADLRINVADYNGTLTETLTLIGQSTNPSATSTGSATTGHKSVRVGVRKAVPLSTLDIGGSMSVPIRLITATSEVDEVDRHIVSNDGGGTAVTLTLPSLAVVGDGRMYTITNYGSSACTLEGYSSDDITSPLGAANTFGLSATKNCTIISRYNGGSSASWYLVGYFL